MSQKNEREMSEGSRLQKIGSAVFFGLSSILIVFINKSGQRVFKAIFSKVDVPWLSDTKLSDFRTSTVVVRFRPV